MSYIVDGNKEWVYIKDFLINHLKEESDEVER